MLAYNSGNGSLFLTLYNERCQESEGENPPSQYPRCEKGSEMFRVNNSVFSLPSVYTVSFAVSAGKQYIFIKEAYWQPYPPCSSSAVPEKYCLHQIDSSHNRFDDGLMNLIIALGGRVFSLFHFEIFHYLRQLGALALNSGSYSTGIKTWKGEKKSLSHYWGTIVAVE